jgi:hypothetical protein
MIELSSTWPGLVATSKAEKQEPDDLTIAYMSGLHDGKKKRTWVGLTDEEIGMAFRAVFPVGNVVFTNGATEFAQIIERKLKEKNT